MNRRLNPLLRTLITVCLLAITLTSAPTHHVTAQDEVSDLLGRINALRASVGRSPYSYNAILSAAAHEQAQWMVDTGTIDHFHPDGSSPRSRALNAGYPSAMISENIYGGSNASADVAWTFWINSPIHYAGLTSPNYADVGIGIASSGWGRAYVLEFGNPGVSYTAPASSSSGSSASNSSGSGSSNSAASAPARIYAVGFDEYGNIKHLIATGDTMGDIALIYGYTWDDIPRMLALNNMGDARDLVPGDIFLVPPHDGTYTPTPGGPSDTPAPTSTPLPATITPFVLPTNTPQIPTANPMPPGVSTVGGMSAFATATIPPDVLATMRVSELAVVSSSSDSTLSPIPLTPTTGTEIAALGTAPPTGTPSVIGTTSGNSRNSSQTWIMIALLAQVAIVGAAVFEFVRRTMVKRGTPKRPGARKGESIPAPRSTSTGEYPRSRSRSDDVIGQPIKRGRR